MLILRCFQAIKVAAGKKDSQSFKRSKRQKVLEWIDISCWEMKEVDKGDG